MREIAEDVVSVAAKSSNLDEWVHHSSAILLKMSWWSWWHTSFGRALPLRLIDLHRMPLHD
jgi:hypothetical protein